MEGNTVNCDYGSYSINAVCVCVVLYIYGNSSHVVSVGTRYRHYHGN